ncbi:MAG: phospholipase D family protein [Alphaproteobacteria bacterium]|nr:phospholipase D family protein [Alphaproteobacteria bacterium]MDE2336742.1 phospholipase D family protein [Alphaproteobacteria bacterium]
MMLALLLFAAPPAFAAPAGLEDAFSPRGGASRLVEHAVHDAKKSILVAAYSFTSKPIARALAAARGRGVDVRVVLDKNPYNRPIAAYLGEHGIPVRISAQYNLMHDKFMVIDGATVELGSFNYTYSAEYDNAENVMVVSNVPAIAADYARQWDDIWAGAGSR